jgi:drug/metabolite transporter (DMT)-like permease
MVWAVGILSVAATLAMMWLIDNNAAATVSSLFFVTPSLSAIEAAVMFRERLGPTAIVGMVLAAFAVRLVTTAPRTTVSSAVEAVTCASSLRPRRVTWWSSRSRRNVSDSHGAGSTRRRTTRVTCS